MKFIPSRLSGAWLLEVERMSDARGFFARTYCRDEFSAHGLNPDFLQASVSHNERAGTLRGMHFQAVPDEEHKLVRCTAGAIFDVIVDVRPESPTFGQWDGFELSSENRSGVYIPRGFAHGFITLADRTELSYQITARHAPLSARGFRWDDPDVAIAWPREPEVISARDQALPTFRELSQSLGHALRGNPAAGVEA